MPSPPPVIDALRRLAGAVPDDVSDADLLARFVAGQDQEAFAALVRRHGGLVWGACRRRLKDAHAAEDAFQTTFLALARHAGTVRRPDALGAWLHRVAVRCTAAFRRPVRDPMSAPPPDAPALGPDPAAAAAGRDLERVIDAEIDALPEPFREAFVLCEVEDQTASAAAQALGCPVGTVESRLARARARLRERLARRGVTAGSLAGLGLAAVPAPSAASAGAVAVATGVARSPGLWALIADRAAGHGMATLGVGLVGSLVLVGLGGLALTLTQSGGARDPALAPAARQPAPVPDIPVPEPDPFRRNRFNFPLPPEAIARVGDPWLRHGAVPHKLAFSGDGRFLAAAGPGDRWLRVWDLAGARPRMHYPLGPGEVPAAVGLTPDGATLRVLVHTGGPKPEAQLREYDTFRGLELRRRAVAGGPPTAAAFDADARHLVEARDGLVCRVDAATAAETWRTPVAPGSPVELAVCAAAGRVAVLPAAADRVRLLDLATGHPAGELGEDGARLGHPTFSADGRRLAAWCPDRLWVRVWDVADGRVAHTIDPKVSAARLALRPDGEEVAVFGGSWPALWPVRAGAEARTLNQGMGITGRFSPDGSVLAMATRNGVVQLLDVRTGRPHRAAPPDPRAGPGEVLTPVPVAFSPDGKRLLARGSQSWQDYATSGDERPWVFVPGRRPNEPYLMPADYRTALSADRSTLARCTFEKTAAGNTFGIDLVNAVKGGVTGRIELPQVAHHPAFSPDGRLVYAITNKQVHGWDVRTGRLVMRGERDAGVVVYKVLVSADGRYVATADNVRTDGQRENAIQVWDAATGEVVLAADGCHDRPHVAFSPDGRRFAAAAVGGDGNDSHHEVRVWDLAGRQVVAAVRGHDGQPAFSPDGRTLAVTQNDSVVLLELATRQVRHVFKHHGPVEPALAWRPDGRVLAAASPEAPMYLWDVVGDRTGSPPAWDPAADAARWAALTGDDGAAAFQAVRQLWAHAEKAVGFLKARVPATADARVAARACEGLELIGTTDARAVLAAWAQGDPRSALTLEAKESLRRLNAGTN